MYRRKQHLILIVLLILFCSDIKAQLNLKIGYTSAYSKFNSNNQILKSYNDFYAQLEKDFKDLHVLHGLQLGFRYRFSNVGAEFTWENLGRDREAIGFDVNNNVFTDKLFYTTNTFSFGLENYFGSFGYGASIGSRQFKVKTEIPTTDTKRKIIQQNELSAKFYMLFRLQESDLVSFVFKPFVQIPLGEYDLSPLNNELLPDSSSESIIEEPWFFGISLIFYNGRQ